jgi:hypothetical protein
MKKAKIKALKKLLKQSKRIIAAKDQVIAAKEQELLTIKAVYGLPKPETKPAEKSAAKPVVEEGFRLISPGLFSQRMQEFGLSIEEVKRLIVTAILDGSMDFMEEGLVIEDGFFSRFERKSTYWEKRNS